MVQEVAEGETRFSTPRGEETRRKILKLAVDFATVKGLEALTIGRLAKEIGMSKSGIFAHFGSKEELQLSTVSAAGALFSEEVLVPARDSDVGIVRLYDLVLSWLGWVESNKECGGCFFVAASMEFDGRPGRVRDRLVDLTKSWLVLLEEESRIARERGELLPTTDPKLLAFAAHAYVTEANWMSQLLEDDKAFVRARRVFDQRLKGFATEKGLRRISAMHRSKG